MIELERPADAAGARAVASPATWCGVLPVDKPAGPTSHDVIDRVRRRLGVATAGHLGTLDPGATGLLVVAIGAATRCLPVWQGGLKTYEGTALFGVVTSTRDLSGEVLEERPVALDEATIREASRAFVGVIEQVPPMVSALKRGGERLYRLARRGVPVALEPRRVEVLAWDWLGFELPRGTFRVRCSSGTYVRSLVHDLGQRLGSGRALADLRRTASEPFSIDRAIPLEELEHSPREEVLARAGIPLETALGTLPRIDLDEPAVGAFGHGRTVSVPEAPRVAGGESEGRSLTPGPRSVAFFGPGGRAVAVGEVVRGEDGALLARPHVVFPWAVR